MNDPVWRKGNTLVAFARGGFIGILAVCAAALVIDTYVAITFLLRTLCSR